MSTTSKPGAEITRPTDLISDVEVLALFPGRWKSRRALGRSGIPGRVLVSGNRAAYRRADVESYLQAEGQRRAEKLAAMQARAAVARAARAAKRAAPALEVDVLLDAIDAAAAAAAAIAAGRGAT